MAKDYKKDYKEFWKDIVETNGVLDLDKVQRELSDFHFMLKEVPKVYEEVSGGKISYPNTYASEVLKEFGDEYWCKDTIREDIESILKDKEVSAEEKLKEIKSYLEI